MNLGDEVGAGQDQKVIVALEIRRPVVKTLPTKVGLAETGVLQHGAHATVQHEDACFKTLGECGSQCRG